MRWDLQKTAVEIFKFSDANNITVFPKWIPRTQNTLADRISKIRDNSNWAVHDNFFNYYNHSSIIMVHLAELGHEIR